MHLILTGATGVVGSGVLDAMLRTSSITKISILSRRPVAMADAAKDPRVNVIIHKDFNTYDERVLDALRGATGCVWALGVSQTQVGVEEYVKITKDYALSAAKAFQSLPTPSPTESQPKFNFIFVSGAGATFKPGLTTATFGRVKGETELALGKLRLANPSLAAESVRLAIVDPTLHAAVRPYLASDWRYNTFCGWSVARTLATLVGSMSSPTELSGKFLTEMAMGAYEGKIEGPGVERLEGGMNILENKAMWRLYKQRHP